MRLRAAGRFVPLDGGPGFLIEGWPRPLPAEGGAAGRDAAATIEADVAAEDDTAVRLRNVAPAGSGSRPRGSDRALP